jgi:hypothetical protein
LHRNEGSGLCRAVVHGYYGLGAKEAVLETGRIVTEDPLNLLVECVTQIARNCSDPYGC